MLRTVVLLLSLMLFQVQTSSQKVYFYGVNSRPLEGMEDAIMTRTVTKKSEKKYVIMCEELVNAEWKKGIRQKIRILDKENLMIREKQPRKLFPRRIHRAITEKGDGSYLFIDATPNRVIRKGSSTSYLPLHLEGYLTEFYASGNISSESYYMDNQLVSNKNWLPDGSRYIDSVFYSADREPVYEPGVEFFNNYLIQKLKRSNFDLTQIQDEVVIGWVIMEDGTMSGVVALQGKSGQLNQFLVNAIAELPGEWEPARLNGHPVRFFISIPLNFMSKDVSFQEVELSTGRLHYSKY